MAHQRLVQWISEVEDALTMKNHQESNLGVADDSNNSSSGGGGGGASASARGAVGGTRAPRVLLGCSGSVATIKVPLVAAALQRCGVRVVVLPTAPALHFLLAAAPEHRVSCRETCSPQHQLDRPKTSEDQKNPLLQSAREQLAPNSENAQFKNDHCSSSGQCRVASSKVVKESGFTSLPETESADCFRGAGLSAKCFKCSQLFHSHKFISVSEKPQGSQKLSPSRAHEMMEVNSLGSPNSCSQNWPHNSENTPVRVCGWCQVQHLYPDLTFAGDEMEWEAWRGRGDPVLHIQLRRWADVLVVAPLSANTLAKLAYGLCDNLLTCVARAWDPQKPLLFCPAMNTFMYDHPFTAQHVHKLKELGYIEVPAVSKRLMCGDVGSGAMAEVPDIVAAVLEALVARGFHVTSAGS